MRDWSGAREKHASVWHAQKVPRDPTWACHITDKSHLNASWSQSKAFSLRRADMYQKHGSTYVSLPSQDVSLVDTRRERKTPARERHTRFHRSPAYATFSSLRSLALTAREESKANSRRKFCEWKHFSVISKSSVGTDAGRDLLSPVLNRKKEKKSLKCEKNLWTICLQLLRSVLTNWNISELFRIISRREKRNLIYIEKLSQKVPRDLQLLPTHSMDFNESQVQ